MAGVRSSGVYHVWRYSWLPFPILLKSEWVYDMVLGEREATGRLSRLDRDKRAPHKKD